VIGTAVPASFGRQVTKGPISAGRQWGELRFFPGPAGKRRRKRWSSSSATRLPRFLVDRG